MVNHPFTGLSDVEYARWLQSGKVAAAKLGLERLDNWAMCRTMYGVEVSAELLISADTDDLVSEMRKVLVHRMGRWEVFKALFTRRPPAA